MEIQKILEAIDNNDLEYLNTLNEEDEKFAENAISFYKKSNVDKGINIISESHKLNEVSMNLKPTIQLSLDNDGNILLLKHENVDFMTIYSNSHELLKEYDKVNNYEGIKYELCKLWMMKTLIDIKIIYPKGIRGKLITNDKKQFATKSKAFIMNDFKTYLRKLLQHDKNFNFNKYFNKTQFGVEVYKLDNRVIKAIKKIAI